MAPPSKFNRQWYWAISVDWRQKKNMFIPWQMPSVYSTKGQYQMVEVLRLPQVFHQRFRNYSPRCEFRTSSAHLALTPFNYTIEHLCASRSGLDFNCYIYLVVQILLSTSINNLKTRTKMDGANHGGQSEFSLLEFSANTIQYLGLEARVHSWYSIIYSKMQCATFTEKSHMRCNMRSCNSLLVFLIIGCTRFTTIMCCSCSFTLRKLAQKPNIFYAWSNSKLPASLSVKRGWQFDKHNTGPTS